MLQGDIIFLKHAINSIWFVDNVYTNISIILCNYCFSTIFFFFYQKNINYLIDGKTTITFNVYFFIIEKATTVVRIQINIITQPY